MEAVTDNLERSYENPLGIATSIVLSVLLMLSIGCQGPAGPDGDEAILDDPVSPVILWLAPAAGDTINGVDTLRVIASDNLKVLRLTFFIAGFEYAGSLIDSSAGMYELIWETDHWPSGPYPLMVRVWDEARNDAETPVVIVYLVD